MKPTYSHIILPMNLSLSVVPFIIRAAESEFFYRGDALFSPNEQCQCTEDNQ